MTDPVLADRPAHSTGGTERFTIEDVQRAVSRAHRLVARAADVGRRAAELRGAAIDGRTRRLLGRRTRMRTQRRTDPREQLVRDNLLLARQIAGHFTGRGQSYEDLYQVACLGLVKAATRFDAARGVGFRTYAHAVISGELKRHFRDHGWGLHVARPVQEMFLAVRETRDQLTQDLGRSPTVVEVAAALHTDQAAVVEALQAGETFYLESVDAPLRPDEPSVRRVVAAEDRGFRRVEERSWLVPAIEQLAERDRLILELRFFDGMSQSQIASRLGISQMHVSRLLSRTLSRLRESAESTSPPRAG